MIERFGAFSICIGLATLGACGGVDSVDDGRREESAGRSGNGAGAEAGNSSGGRTASAGTGGASGAPGAGGQGASGSGGYAAEPGSDAGASGTSSGAGASGPNPGLCAPDIPCGGIDTCTDTCFGNGCCRITCWCRIERLVCNMTC